MAEVAKSTQTTNAEVLRDETTPGANTKTRVYDLLKDLIDSSIFFDQLYGVASGTNTYTVTIAGFTAYASTRILAIKFTNSNTGAATLNVNGIGPIAIKKEVSADLVSGDIDSGQVFLLVYDGTNFQIFGASGTVQSVTGDGVDNTDPDNPVIDITQSRTVTGADSIVQTDNIKTIYFNSASPFNFTIDQLIADTEVAFINIGAGVVTFVAGAGVTISGVTSLPGSENATAVILYRTATNPLIVSGGGSGVETVTGDGVDNTDPDNPVLSYPAASDIGLGNVNNTSDEDKPISTAQATEFTRIENLIGKSDLGSSI